MAKFDMDEHAPLDQEHEEDEQTFAPTPVEKPKSVARGGRHRRLVSLEHLRDHAKNRYEGVLIASARARQLNAKKIAMEERGMEDAIELKRLKMTTFAMTELIEGKIKVERPNESFEKPSE
jgi:DNA-directed RNA polymerase subunit K/omega